MVEGSEKFRDLKSPSFAHFGDDAEEMAENLTLFSEGLGDPVLYLVPCLPKGFDLILF
jgi:hypothetical protein